MSFYNRIAITIVRLAAGGFILVGILNLALEWFRNHQAHTDTSVWRWMYLCIPLVIGIAILIKSSALAQWIDEYLDE